MGTIWSAINVNTDTSLLTINAKPMRTIFLNSRFRDNTVVNINPDTTLSVFFIIYHSDDTQQNKEL